jgi:hypothetical protein
VHVSDTTAELITNRFPLETHIEAGHEAMRGLEEGFGMQRTFIVNETAINMSIYAPLGHAFQTDNEGGFSEGLGNEEMLAIDQVLGADSAASRSSLHNRPLRHCLNMLTRPRPRILAGGGGNIDRGSAGSVSNLRRLAGGGSGEVTNVIAFMKKLAEPVRASEPTPPLHDAHAQSTPSTPRTLCAPRAPHTPRTRTLRHCL